MIALLGAGLGIGVAVKGNRASAQETVESLVLPVPPAPTAIMDLPLPAACTDPALAEFKVGLLAYRDGIWDQAHRAFERAAEADPNCAEAHLRLVMTGHHRYSPSKTRQVFQRAVQIRAKLTERDQLLLNAFEPLVRSDPANEAEYYERLRALAERFPGDAELANLAATKERDRDVKIELAIKAIVTDTHYSDAWQTLGVAYADKGQTDEALSALAACLDAALNSVDCVRERIALLRLGLTRSSAVFAVLVRVATLSCRLRGTSSRGGSASGLRSCTGLGIASLGTSSPAARRRSRSARVSSTERAPFRSASRWRI